MKVLAGIICIFLSLDTVDGAIKKCTPEEYKDIKQCVYKYMEEVYENLDDFKNNRSMSQLMTRLLSNQGDCRKYWMFAICVRSVDPCYQNSRDISEEQTAQLNAAFAFKYSECSGNKLNETKDIIGCLDKFYANETCITNTDLMQTAEGCVKNGAKYIGCMKTALETCTFKSTKDQQKIMKLKITTCQLHTFRMAKSCLQFNCASMFVERNHLDK